MLSRNKSFLLLTGSAVCLLTVLLFSCVSGCAQSCGDTGCGLFCDFSGYSIGFLSLSPDGDAFEELIGVGATIQLENKAGDSIGNVAQGISNEGGFVVAASGCGRCDPDISDPSITGPGNFFSSFVIADQLICSNSLNQVGLTLPRKAVRAIITLHLNEGDRSLAIDVEEQSTACFACDDATDLNCARGSGFSFFSCRLELGTIRILPDGLEHPPFNP